MARPGRLVNCSLVFLLVIRCTRAPGQTGQQRSLEPGSHDSSAPGIITASASGRHTFLTRADPTATCYDAPACIARAAPPRLARFALQRSSVRVRCSLSFSLSLPFPLSIRLCFPSYFFSLLSLARANAFRERPVWYRRAEPDGTIDVDRSHGTRSQEMRQSGRRRRATPSHKYCYHHDYYRFYYYCCYHYYTIGTHTARQTARNRSRNKPERTLLILRYRARAVANHRPSERTMAAPAWGPRASARTHVVRTRLINLIFSAAFSSVFFCFVSTSFINRCLFAMAALSTSVARARARTERARRIFRPRGQSGRTADSHVRRRDSDATCPWDGLSRES